VRPEIRVGSTFYRGTNFALTSSYANYSYLWRYNPATLGVWAWADIIALQVGIRLRGQNAVFPANCTQVWVEVSYVP
jgi:hypothetical protein